MHVESTARAAPHCIRSAALLASTPPDATRSGAERRTAAVWAAVGLGSLRGSQALDLASDEAQAILAEANNEYPAVRGAPVPEGLKPYAGFKADPLSVAVYGRRQAEAQAVFDEAGWR